MSSTSARSSTPISRHDPFWPAPRSLFLGVTLYVLERHRAPPTLGVLRQGMASQRRVQPSLETHHRGRQSGRFHCRPVRRALCDVIDLAPVTASSIRKTFTSRLDLLATRCLICHVAQRLRPARTAASAISIYIAFVRGPSSA